MTEHRLDALLKPASIALLGVSERAGSPGQVLARMVVESDYRGDAYLVNPRYPELLGRPCYASLDALPRSVEHVVIALANEHLEKALRAAIEHGAKAATIYSSAVLDEDSEPPLNQRLGAMARAAGLQLCGVNGMGFYNLEQQLYAGIFARSAPLPRGGISYIAQSGSAFAALSHNGCRLGFNLCVSAGNEMTTTVADYMDWCLEQTDTRVIALFLETVRDPPAFVAALQRARRLDIPVVVLKIGKSPQSAAMAVTHTGAIAGNHAAFRALCRRHGVIEVDDFDEMAATLMLLQNRHLTAAGGFAAVFESGGFRELVTDLALELGLEFAALEDATLQAIECQLDPGLKAENPLDLWGSQDRFEARIEACLRALMRDPNVGAGAFFSNFRDGYFLSEAIYRCVDKVSRETGKPLVLANLYPDLDNSVMCARGFTDGVAILDGTRAALLAFRHLFAYRDGKLQGDSPQANLELDDACVGSWRQRLRGHVGSTLGEVDALALLRDFALPVIGHELVASPAQLAAAAQRLGYPLVLKTAQPGINHKSDCAGVFVGITREDELQRHYADIANRLGAPALVARMAGADIEIALGTITDAQFGPVLMVAAGGIMVEILDDRAWALCPLNPAQADAMLASLKVDRLLRGLRGRPAAQRPALIDAIVRLSRLACELRDEIAEIDINPVMVGCDNVVAVDALILCKEIDA